MTCFFINFVIDIRWNFSDKCKASKFWRVTLRLLLANVVKHFYEANLEHLDLHPSWNNTTREFKKSTVLKYNLHEIAFLFLHFVQVQASEQTFKGFSNFGEI